MEAARASSVFYGCPLLGIKDGEYSSFTFNEQEWAEALRSMPGDLLCEALLGFVRRS